MRQPDNRAVDPARAIIPAVVEDMLTTRNSKWTLVVVLHLRHETMRFSELQRDIGTISQKALTASLRALERDGFVRRTSYATIPPRVDYALTDLGEEALVAFEAFERFAGKHWHRVLDARRVFDARELPNPVSSLRTGSY
jgi:DNA-binding HxlR family transcriptional regulator